MKKILLWVAAIATIVAVVCGVVISHLIEENGRLERNQRALMGEVQAEVLRVIERFRENRLPWVTIGVAIGVLIVMIQGIVQ